MKNLLKTGGYINIAIAALHLIGLAWAKQMFEATGIAKEMQEMSAYHVLLPYVLTVFVAIFFALFGLYALSAAGQFRQLPYAKAAVLIVAAIYFSRGFGTLIYDAALARLNVNETIFSVCAIAIGTLYALGWYGVYKKSRR